MIVLVEHHDATDKANIVVVPVKSTSQKFPSKLLASVSSKQIALPFDRNTHHAKYIIDFDGINSSKTTIASHFNGENERKTFYSSIRGFLINFFISHTIVDTIATVTTSNDDRSSSWTNTKCRLNANNAHIKRLLNDEQQWFLFCFGSVKKLRKSPAHSNGNGNGNRKSKLLATMEILRLMLMMITTTVMVFLPTTNNQNGYEIYAADILLLPNVFLANILLAIASKLRTLASPTYFQCADQHKFKSVKFTERKQIQRLAQQALYTLRIRNVVTVGEYIMLAMIAALRRINTNNNNNSNNNNNNKSNSNNNNNNDNNFCDNFLMKFNPVSNLIIEIDVSSIFVNCANVKVGNVAIDGFMILAIVHKYCLRLAKPSSTTINHRFSQQKRQQQNRWRQLHEMMPCHHSAYAQIFSYYALIYSNKSIYCQHLHCTDNGAKDGMTTMDVPVQIDVCIVVRINDSNRVAGYLTMTTDRFKKVNKIHQSIESSTVAATTTTARTTCANFSTVINLLSVLLTYGALMLKRQPNVREAEVAAAAAHRGELRRNCVQNETKSTGIASNNEQLGTTASSSGANVFCAREISLENGFRKPNKICVATNTTFWRSSENRSTSTSGVWNYLNVLSASKAATAATTTGKTAAAVLAAASLLLKKHIFLLVIAFLTCVPISVTTATMHNMKYSTNLVKTKYGQLRGIVVRSNPTVEAYLGVPYATPPIGSLRYMPPVTPSTWKNTRLADRFSPVCPQLPPVTPTGPEALLEIPRERLAQIRRLLPLLANQSEDCLYLNLYVPRADEDTQNTGDKSLATIVYIHGESFEWNSGNPYDGSILAAHGSVIVVTINFRLGVLGFLKTGARGSAQGNFGLMDLVAGLHWLRENLPAFNGDPTKVTLMGHGTGASLANILMVSPVSSDLIRRGILLSGSALSPWAIQKDPLYMKRKVAEHTGCHGDLVEDDLAPCLRTKPVSELLSVPLETPRFLPGFAPFVDGTVIVSFGSAANSQFSLPIGSAVASTMGAEMADFAKRELLFGVTTIESYLDLSAQDLEFGFNETRRDRILRTYVRNVYYYHLNEIYAALKNEYTDWEKPPRNPLGSRDAALELLSDGHTAAPLVRLAYLHSLRGGRSYFMHFKHQSNERDFPQRSGSVRGEDVPFCLGLPISPLFPHNHTKQDIKISRMMVQYISNFAHSGNPNETPPSSLHISHTKHNHIASPIEEADKLTSAAESDSINHKQKRQMNSMVARRRSKRSRVQNEYDTEEDEENDENEHEHDSDESNESEETVEKNNHDRLDETSNQHYPFWDSYDSVNQLYLQIGNKIEIKNHYRGHKLSMWLSLIPQLHMPGELSEMSMRHHHFSDNDKKFYDGIIREQSIEMPIVPKPRDIATTPMTKLDNNIVSTTSTTVTTECPSNATVVPTLAATKPQHNIAHSADDNLAANNQIMDSFLRRLTNNQFQSYSTALTVTIGVGCFLLLLNVLIFAGIYYQRERRAHDAKKKEELVESESRCSPNFSDRAESSHGKKNFHMSNYATNGSFGEYSCYDEKMMCKEKHLLADICSVEIPMQELKCKSNGTESNTSSLRRPTHSSHSTDSLLKQNSIHVSMNNPSLLLYPPTYSSPHLAPSSDVACGSGNLNELVTYHQFQPQNQSKTTQSTDMAYTSAVSELSDERRFCHAQTQVQHCNQSTQSDPVSVLPYAPSSFGKTDLSSKSMAPASPMKHDVGTTAMEQDVDDRRLNDRDEIGGGSGIDKASSTTSSSLRSSISTSTAYQGGILRNQQGGPTTPSASKKRVQIQEISV